MFSRLLSLTTKARLRAASAAAIIVLLMAGATWAQAPAPQSQAPSQNSGSPLAQSGAPPSTPSQASPPATQSRASQQPNGSGTSVQEQPPANSGSQDSSHAEPETRITKAQAKELFRSVDQILEFASHDTGLPIEHQVKRNLITREQVEKYVNKRMKDDKDARRLEEAQLVLTKFGLLPKGYDLHAEFVRLMAEQVAAYYDPKTQSVNLLDWLPAEAQKPVLAHELTHALQDQQVGLEKWELAGAKDDAPLPDQQEYAAEEAQSARQCVTEGQAQVVWFNYTLAPLGKNILTAPEFVDKIRAAMGDNKDSPVFSEAPIFLQESLLMPYTFGFDFVRTVLTNKGVDVAFDGLLHNPPVDTRQIMQPETYLLHQVVAPPVVPDLDALVGPDYKRVDFGSMGEFDVYLLAKQYGVADPPNYYRHWRGGYYFATRPKNTAKDQIAMLYYSKWDSPEATYDFAKLYADYVPKRYGKEYQGTSSSCPVGSNGARPGSCHVIHDMTSEGPVVIEWNDNNELLIMEGYDQAGMDRARNVLLNHTSQPPAGTTGKK